ncbi:ABC transporter substrate-binding protein [Mycolicibacterium brisbanense]|uniref:Peptide/opine/nickel uptake ABC transporter peri plasmic substrate-binding protein n=1 Tax=Mycolicibacterium brisbanense TaxID=146020 RepID=A0A100VXA9_9MYCO|nr:ABC transporter substrate-binding protein [Mycolicibacterium brisbanense]MCV7159182.1 ABC transporter substrate-binding protein [Mycolicibacterium brisbanense]GAS87732.1 peptide/opine/nickel uptake ABC transporter peri plasmic substrate-binding protein, precursor [Mycolicibacterium brisbanense]
MHKRILTTLAGVTTVALLAGCSSGQRPQAGAGQIDYTTTSPAATGHLDKVTWNLQYEPSSLDPVHSGNYAENQVIANLCDTLLRVPPTDASKIDPALATKASNPTPTDWVYDLNPAAKFWDGTAVTPEDVIFSLMRNKDTSLNSYYAEAFTQVKSIDKTGDHQITVHLNTPNAEFNRAMASPAGTVVKQAYAQAQGDKYGSPTGGAMCSGPFRFGSWTPGKDLTIQRNPNYWDTSLAPKVDNVTFTFIGDGATLANALLSGQVDGSYQLPWDGLGRLSSSSVGSVYYARSPIVFSLIISAESGPLKDPKIRRALALSLDRDGIISNAFAGAALPVKALATPQTWTYAKDVYSKAYDDLPALTQNLDEAKKLVSEAGSPKDEIVLAYAGGASQYVATIFDSIQQTGKQIGLNITLKPIPVKTYNSIFGDASLQKGVDAFETDWYPDLNDPLSWYGMFVKGASSLTFGYDNPTVNSSLTEARATSDDTARAQLVTKGQQQIMADLPWIPVAEEANTLFMNKRVTGAPVSFVQLSYPWAALLGAR